MIPTSHSPTNSATTISRYPTIESPDEVKTNKEFAVQISLTEDQMTPEVTIKPPSGNKKSARVTSGGQLQMNLTGAPQQKE